MISLRGFFYQHGIPGWALAIGLVIIGRGPAWWGYALLRYSDHGKLHPIAAQAVCALYFSCLAWVLVFLCADLTRYPSMSKDALLGGCLLDVAAVVHDADVSTLLSSKGFAGATWFVLICTCGFLIRTSFASLQSRNGGGPKNGCPK
jgi:hypothetical protein